MYKKRKIPKVEIALIYSKEINVCSLVLCHYMTPKSMAVYDSQKQHDQHLPIYMHPLGRRGLRRLYVEYIYVIYIECKLLTYILIYRIPEVQYTSAEL